MDEIITHATYKCLCCGYRDKVRGKRKDYKEINVCPKCDGAFVDIYHLHKYQTKSPAKDIEVTPLLVIELENETAVPKVFYQGEEITRKTRVAFGWETKKADVESEGLMYDINYFEPVDGVTCRRGYGLRRGKYSFDDE